MHFTPDCDALSFPISAFEVSVDVPHEVDVDRLGDAIAEAAAHIDAATHQLLSMICRFDACEGYARQGAKTCAQWLSWRIGLAPGAAREHVRVARALVELPVMDAALRCGKLSYSKVRAMTRVATPENETRIVEMARHATGAELEKICRGLRSVVGSAGSELVGRAERWVRHRTTDNGMVRIEAQLHPDEAAIVLKALAEARRAASGAGCSAVVGGVPAGTSAGSPPAEMDLETDSETDFGARQADALVHVTDSFLALGSKSRSGAERTQLFVHLAPSRLDPETRLEATLQDGTVLSSETFLRLACDGGLLPVRSGEDGVPLDVGRRTRTIPPNIHRALRARDRGCQFPGCICTAFVDAHHVEHWAQGGETKLSNLLQLCRRHHTAVHEGGFRVQRAEPADCAEHAGGPFVFYTPGGELLPRVPQRPGVPGETLRFLRARHAARGLSIHADIQLGSFRLEAVDYDAAVAGLLPRDSGRAGPPCLPAG